MSLKTRAQLRAARALLDWTQSDLAERCGLTSRSIHRLEDGDGILATKVETLHKLQAALEAAGVIFIPANGGGSGVRLRED
ncbi:helix-turn-helix transcriptional regulator [Pelagibius litoralis]|uniref:Helix-turn-helix transcriptional regulator n=1 Tax=Pelagibius litoralis TaxID=374515 RepID=A0A967C7R5_9PROT|nr:helix-turn-helix transcriptional regulator [Pelagibius litoralis]NIA68127.1 helix-turn-helix transcriptional regulator [Pelagibius litoralis]